MAYTRAMPTESASENQVYCSQCGRACTAAEVVVLGGAPLCARCKPIYLSRLQAGAAPGAMRYKGFWIRAVELIVDGILLDALFSPFLIAMMLPLFRAAMTGRQPSVLMVGALSRQLVVFDLLFFTAFIAYNTLMLGRFGATLGDMVIGAVVVTPEGGRISYARALGRTLMKEVSGLILGIGYFIAAFDEQKRTLHDRVAGTVVVARG